MADLSTLDRVFDVLLVEDNPSEARLAQEALSESTLAPRVHLVNNGDDALDFVRRQGAHTAAVAPDLILLDLNLPRRGGHEVLRAIKSDPQLCHIPVIVLTTSTNEDDVRRAYQNNANCYVSKPLDLDRFIEFVQLLSSFWFRVVNLPPKSTENLIP
jgi:chemotaxis family two-component system response regulator Rcp1